MLIIELRQRITTHTIFHVLVIKGLEISGFLISLVQIHAPIDNVIEEKSEKMEPKRYDVYNVNWWNTKFEGFISSSLFVVNELNNYVWIDIPETNVLFSARNGFILFSTNFRHSFSIE